MKEAKEGYAGRRALGRKDARDAAFKLLFQAQEQGEDIYELLDEELAKPYKEQDRRYLGSAVKGAISHAESLDQLIQANSKGWQKDRISKVCMTAMRLALYEMLYMDDIPQGVSINEAVELVKRYESPDAAAFVNGILGSVQSSGGQKGENQ